jgi:hypothetical protein
MTFEPPFPRPVGDRFNQLLASLAARLRKVEAKTVTLDTGVLVCNRVGTIPGSYTSGDATVLFAGQSAASGPYPSLSTYTPHAGDTVLCVPNGQSYVILGKFS